MDGDSAIDAVVAALIDFIDAAPGHRHRVAASLPAVAEDLRVEVASTAGRVVVVVSPATDDWTSLLTRRERDVAAAVARGLTNQQIADQLFMSVGTVKDHVHHILAKTGLANRAAIAGRWRAGKHR